MEDRKMDSNNPTRSPEILGSVRWFVVHTKPKDEYRVKTHLGTLKIETLLPLCHDFRYVQGKMSPIIHPLFPSYLFARLDIEQHYPKVKYTRGVTRILGVGNEPTPISDAVIEMLRDRMADDDTVELFRELQDGDLVQVTSGPLKDFVGVFQKGLSTKKRVRILLNMIGVEVPVQISRFQIKKVA